MERPEQSAGTSPKAGIPTVGIPKTGIPTAEIQKAGKTYTGTLPETESFQKTREGCGCFWCLCGSSGGKFRENSRKIAGKIFPNRQMLQILGFRAPGKANLPGTLGPHCRGLVPTFRAGCFLKSTVPAFSSFPEHSKARASEGIAKQAFRSYRDSESGQIQDSLNSDTPLAPSDTA